MSVEMRAGGRQLPTTHVENVVARNQIVFEPREISQSGRRDGRVPHVAGSADVARGPLRQLMKEGAGVKSVAWEHLERERA